MFEQNLKSMFSKAQIKATLADPTKIHTVATSLREFADLDVKGQVNGVKFGEVCFRLLALPLARQKEAVEALAKDLNVPAPEYPDPTGKRSRTFRGRNQLASVVYAAWPNMLEKTGKNKDTAGGKRLSRYYREYQVAAGLRKPVARTSRPINFHSFETFMVNALPSEQEVIIAVLRRAKLDDATLGKWASKVKVVMAPSVAALAAGASAGGQVVSLPKAA